MNTTGKYTLTVKATKGDNITRALSDNGTDIIATWTAGDQVTVYNVTTGEDLEGYLEAQTSGAETTLTGDLTGTINPDDKLTLEFRSDNYTNQQGTLAYIAANCDYATASVDVASVSGSNIVPKAATTTFQNQQAIIKFTLQDKGNAHQ